jgi:uncharacterized protein (TIGR02284 family)
VRAVFDRLSVERSQFAAQWDRLLQKHGSTPGETGHGSGPMRGGWGELEARIRPKDDAEFIMQAADGDERGLKHFQHALDSDVPEEVRSMADRQMRSIEKAVAELRSSVLQHR